MPVTGRLGTVAGGGLWKEGGQGLTAATVSKQPVTGTPGAVGAIRR